MQQKVENYIRKQQLIQQEACVIVGVSGGTDSVALLHLLHTIGYKCIIAHCNFHLREIDADKDQSFVKSLAEQMELPFQQIDFDTKKYAQENKISIEMAARDLRYNWFYELADKFNAQAIASAHHADDSIETLLMNLVRGTGLRGLTGIPCKNGKVIRPLLCCTRKEIENYLIVNKLEHVEDASNAESNYTRNKFRNQVLPLLETIQPSVRETLYETVNRFNGILSIYESAIKSIETEITEKSENNVRINIDLLKSQVDVPTVLFELISPYGFSADQIRQVHEQLDAQSGKFFISKTHRLVKDRDFLIIDVLKNENKDSYLIFGDLATTELPLKLELKALKRDANFKLSKSKNCIHIDASTLQFPLELRHWQNADTFFPIGLNKRKKISDFFIDNKFPINEKENTWLLVSGDKIVWIVGHRMDHRFRIKDSSTDIIEINI